MVFGLLSPRSHREHKECTKTISIRTLLEVLFMPKLLIEIMFAHYQARKNASLRHLFCLLLLWSSTSAQTLQSPRPPEQEEVVHVFTELVQTDVMVFDKQGHFVNGLSPENFVLRIDGKVRPLQSFEQITAGSNEESQLAAARGTQLMPRSNNSTRVIPLDRGRTVFFYVDDLHLDLSGLNATKKLVTNFIDKEMGQNDEVAIISASGEIGFLQQLTDNRLVLREALNRINPRWQTNRDNESPAMTEYNALLIDKNDYDTLGYFVDETMRLNSGLTRDIAANIVRSRANALLGQASRVTVDTLSGLAGAIRSVKSIPGRKLLFLLSNGFLIDDSHSDVSSRLRQITSAAAQTGVVIYSMDARGLVAPFGDASSPTSFDPSARLDRANHDELFATQDGLNALARDTGGKAVFNTNDFKPGLRGALKETSVYYLLAWKPEKTGNRPARFRNIDVSIVGRPDLIVRVRRGFFDAAPATPASVVDSASSKPAGLENKQGDPNKVAATKLKETIVAPYPDSKIPLSLSLDYHDVVGKGSTISASVQVPGEFLAFGSEGEKTQAQLDVAGAFYNDRGQATLSFYDRVVTTAPSAEAARGYQGDITYTYPAKLAPGLYQVRIAVRDFKSGRAGSVRAWIEIPDLSKRQLTLSSLLLGEHSQSPINNVSNSDDIRPVSLNPSHRFRRESSLRFLVFLYNAVRSSSDSQPDAAIQILQVTVIDRVSKRSASQQTHFDVY